MMITNEQFLSAIFGDDAPWAHVTCFTHPPDAIPADRHLAAWAGGYACQYLMQPETNQYFTISTFYADQEGKARRRKALFRHTHCIVLDDVREKLVQEQVDRLPAPSWVLQTSQGSEQWGYILNTPCADRSRVENLLDGLIANGLSPDGKDSGMKGVTRYVRLPQGINNKQSKGYFKCNLILWQPFLRVTMEQLAAPLKVNLDAARRETRVDGAAKVDDHPLLSHESINIKEIRSDGRFDITCPWVHEHTDQLDNGAAVFTNADGSFGFKCHHGACQERTGLDLLRYLDDTQPGFRTKLGEWQMYRAFQQPTAVAPAQAVQTPVNFLGAPDVHNGSDGAGSTANSVGAGDAEVANSSPIDTALGELRTMHPSTPVAREKAQQILRVVDALPKIEQRHWHDELCDLMRWNKSDFKEILKDLRQQWYSSSDQVLARLDNFVFVNELNRFYDYQTRIFYTPEAFQNAYGHEDDEVRRNALIEGQVKKVDKLDYAPREPRIFTQGTTTYANAWDDTSQETGEFGDPSIWLNHFNILEWQEYRQHMLSWMAYTIRHPEFKINHMMLLGSGEGCGKDFILYPLIRAMGDNAEVIGGEELLENFNEYLMSTKYLHVNEVELGDHREAKMVAQRLKPLASAPPEQIGVNRKGISRVKVRNIVNCTMTTNSTLPLRLEGQSRRFFAVWSDFNPRDTQGNMLPHWQDYWEKAWAWMMNGGWKACVSHLMTLDLSNFKPQAAPPTTEFLQQMREDSKNPVLQTIEIFIKKSLGMFTCDILTVQDMCKTLMYSDLFGQDRLVDPKLFTEQRLSKEMRSAGTYRQVRTRQARMWILRNPEKYALMSPNEIYDTYHVAKRKALRDSGVTPVENEGLAV